MPSVLSLPLLQLVKTLPAAALKPAGMGAAVTKWKDSTSRGDSVAWVPLDREFPDTAEHLRPLCASAGWDFFRSTLAQAVEALNLTLKGSERLHLPEKVMVAYYPAGTRYVRHSDVSPTVPHRRVTAILYLNEGWTPSQGGELLLYPSGSEESVRVDPRLGRMILYVD